MWNTCILGKIAFIEKNQILNHTGQGLGYDEDLHIRVKDSDTVLSFVVVENNWCEGVNFIQSAYTNIISFLPSQ